MIRTYKRKLILTTEQSIRIDSWIGCCRLVFNMGMEIKNATYKATGKSASKYDLINQLPELKADYDWIKDVPAQSLQSAIERLETSYQNFFRNFKKGGGFPKFASKRFYKSILFKAVSVKNGVISLPKIGVVKTFKDCEILGKPKTAQIIKEPTGYFICVQCEDVPIKFNSDSQTIGIDVGISHFSVDSNGSFIANPKHFKKYEDRLRIENRSLARKKKGSNSWKKQAARLSKQHHTIGNVRKDFLHKESTKIAKANSIVFMEDLKVKNMVKNTKLSKHILDCGWSMFKTMLAYKTTVVAVDPKYTSQMCYECGLVDKESRKTQSEYCCTKCGHSDNADINAAKNIKRKGIALDRKREALVCALVLEPLSL